MKDTLARESAAALVWNRAYIYGGPEFIEAIYRCRAFLRLPSINDFCRDILTSALGLPILIPNGFKKTFPVIQRPLTFHFSPALLQLF